ncbi:MAG: membrane protein insertase YidC [Microbacteriaceae bacterium]|nr:membrane protein insertase YidC [Microbacteriaceae bacterium]MCI1207443.1 membrane protein insertase YidC [Microbacteriaceae bacterium]
MPDFIGIVMWPIKWAIELVLVVWHWVFTTLGMSPTSGWLWVLCILGLVVVVRSAMIPLMVRQIRSQRKMMELAPELKRIQDKYRGKKDQFSRQAMAQEQMDLYKNGGANPVSGCLPVLVQMPIFFGLFTVMNEAQHGRAGVGLLDKGLAEQFSSARLFGARMSISLTQAFQANPIEWPVLILAVVLVILMISSQLFTSVQIMGQNISEEAKQAPTYRQQRMLMYGMPFLMLFSGVAFPLGVLMYWFINNLWTMGQQFLVIRSMPTPGSKAYYARQERLASRGKLTETEQHELEKYKGVPQGQRVQPVGKARAKKQGKKRRS